MTHPIAHCQLAAAVLTASGRYIKCDTLNCGLESYNLCTASLASLLDQTLATCQGYRRLD